MLRKGETGPERLMPLCSLLKGVMLRRTKEDVGAPCAYFLCPAHLQMLRTCICCFWWQVLKP